MITVIITFKDNTIETTEHSNIEDANSHINTFDNLLIDIIKYIFN